MVARVRLCSETTADIRGFRALALDGALCVGRESAPLVTASLGVARVEHDKRGGMVLIKSKNNTARDDVAQALMLAAGAVHRYLRSNAQASVARVVSV